MVDSALQTLTLRPLVIQDAETFASWADDVDFCREADWSLQLPYELHLAFWRDLISRTPKDLIRLAAIFDGLLVGYVDLQGPQRQRRELGFVIGPRGNWGAGLGQKAAVAAVTYGFQELGLSEIWAEALDANERSVRILQRIGMRETGMGDEVSFQEQKTFYRRFAISAEEWLAISPRNL